MRLLTFQDKYVLEELVLKQNKPMYECKVVAFKNREEALYNKVRDRMIEVLDIPKDRYFVPIWCWVIPKNQEITPEYLDEIYDRHVPSCDRIVSFELDVPKELLMISNYEHWQDLLFKTAFGQTVSDDDFDLLFARKPGAILQVCIPFIHKNHITTYKDYNDFNGRDYSNTDALMHKEIADGLVDLDPTGQFILKYKDS